MTRRSVLTLAGIGAAVGLLLSVTALVLLLQPPSAVGGRAAIGGPFALIDQDGRPVTEASLEGEPSLLFFGYTHCPDVCPTTLNDMSQMLDALGRDKKAQGIFVTVDPERDTPAVLKDYLSNFDPRIKAFTGTPEAIAAMEKSYKVYAKKVSSTDGSYSMDHTAIVYLMDKEGRFVNAFNLEQSPKNAAAEFASYL
ncbi:SCO family protein [Lichenifustis flavocetrariae]|uniref:SCO family protein n=1 Tax=Lichenifustis flavocetrariae TaxID=2949735 RepID=A0AA41Z031_9HYPH|nr:SCO family protein [Lichenifustis flavocetrariae]MCW6508005.1 SCO family protein [Lichenifustis flavocetrariae]